ncbi:MAG: asparagine synthase (glutamine-hydrolyzing) [Candidatus Scalindua sp.]|jgi:asparagine synthase (glutamine-hydrolysing)|nr:asparagine synthase (glutamine-hydrolyzing) [Candidatus Scalindua sp.]
MCGIAGILNFNGEPVSPVLLRRMTDVIAHRGPDGEGFYINKCVGLGHRRLAIIDPSPAGHQPMITEDERFVLTYNGEVYNFQELRLRLETLGYQFRSKTDTEVVLHAYVEWGDECVKYFNGMFAFAIWDNLNQELFLARDRYGIKPFYYVYTGNTFLFASEQKAILSNNDIQRVIDLDALLEYFTFQNIFTDKTLLKGIKIFPAGCTARIAIESPGSKLTLSRYWDFDFREPENPATDDEYLEELDFLLRQAVNRQLVSDVEVGTYLSGGMDSGSITSIAAKQLPYIKTFTCGFDLNSASGLELGYDERQKAEFMSYLFKTEHYEMVLKAGDMERVLSEFAWHLEEPRVGQSYPNYYVAQLASKFVKVVLSGMGGDEIFAGYPWRYYKAVVNDNFEQYIDKYYKFWQRLIPNNEISRMFAPVWPQAKHVWTRDIFRDVFSRHAKELTRPEDYINHSLYFEAKTFLHGLLVVDDKLSMAHGLETRVPFLDNDLVDFSMKIPVRLKLRNLTETISINENELGAKIDKHTQSTNDGKLLFRMVMERYIPKDITSGKKQGFSAPDASWFRGESIEYVKRVILNKNARIYEYFDHSVVQRLVNDHLEHRHNRRLFIWSLLNFEHWCEKYL